MSINYAEPADTAAIQKIELQELDGNEETGEKVVAGNMDLIRDVKVRLATSLGEHELTVQELFDLREGGVLPLDKRTTDPVDIVLDGKVVARGELVVVDDNFGVRVTELAQPLKK